MGTISLEMSRLEAGFIQAGVDFVPADQAVRPGRTRSPFELDLGRLVDFAKPDLQPLPPACRSLQVGLQPDGLRRSHERTAHAAGDLPHAFAAERRQSLAQNRALTRRPYMRGVPIVSSAGNTGSGSVPPDRYSSSKTLSAYKPIW